MGNDKLPPIVWLRVTDWMHAWLQHELVGELRVRDQRVVCVQHLEGGRDVLRMETVMDICDGVDTGSAMSAMKCNCLSEGLKLDAEAMEREYGVTRELMKQMVPIECPKVCLTENGVLRPWTLDRCFGKSQANAMQRLLRKAFWDAVEEYSYQYAKKKNGEYYPQIDMIEDFCAETKIPDEYVPEIRREWQRRVKRGDNKIPEVAKKEVENVELLNL